MVHSGEIDAFEEWWIGDLEVVLDENGVVTTLPFNPYISIDYKLGTADQSVVAMVEAAFPTIWTPEHQLKGIALFAAKFSSPPAEEYQYRFADGHNTHIRTVARLTKVYSLALD